MSEDISNIALNGLLTPTKERSSLDHDEYPGKMNVAMAERGYANGCAFIEFEDVKEPNGDLTTATAQANRWFAEHPNRLVLDIKVAETHGKVRVIVTYTKVVSEEEIAEIEEVTKFVRQELDVRRKKRDEAKEKEAEEKAKQEAEKARLIEVGRKCEANHKKEKKS